MQFLKRLNKKPQDRWAGEKKSGRKKGSTEKKWSKKGELL